MLGEVGDDFEAYINELDRQSRGLDLRDDQVPHSTFWLVDDSDEIVAVSNLRHRLNEFLSELGGHIGFGVLQDEIWADVYSCVVQRYWINTVDDR